MTKEAPADRIKREAAERKAKEDAAKANTPGADDLGEADDQLTEEEQAAVDNADSNDSPPSEDPEVVAQREEKFRRAQEFEARKRARNSETAPIAAAESDQDDPDFGPNVQRIDDDFVAIRVPRAAFNAIHALASAIPSTTPREHVMCGHGSNKLKVGAIRDLAGFRSR